MKLRELTFKRTIVAVCAVLLATVAVTAGAFMANRINTNASVGTDSISATDYARYFVGGTGTGNSEQGDAGALFTAEGIDPTVLSQLMAVLNSSQIGGTSATNIKDAGDFSQFASKNVAQVNGAVYIRLFESLDTSTVAGTNTVNNFTRSENATHGEVGTARWWRIVYLRDGILTLYMADPYRTNAFNGSSSQVNGVDANVYNYDSGTPSTSRSSDVRTALLTDFWGNTTGTGDPTPTSVLGHFPQDVRDAIVPAQDVPWQVPQPNTGLRADDAATDSMSNPAVPGNDRVWLPSWYEVFNTESTQFPNYTFISYGGVNAAVRLGQWNMNGYDRAYSKGNFTGQAWLRSGHSSLSNTVGDVDMSGGKGFQSASNGRDVRPAINIAISSLVHANIQAEVLSDAPDAGVSIPAEGGEGTPKSVNFVTSNVNSEITINAGVGYKINTLQVGTAAAITPTATNEDAAIWTSINGTDTADGEYRAWLTTATKGGYQKLEVRFRNLPAKELEVYAGTTIIDYTITYSTEYGTPPAKTTYTVEDDFIIGSVTDLPTGRTHTGWKLNSVPIIKIYGRRTGDITLVATYGVVQNTVKFTNLKGTAKETMFFNIDTGTFGIGAPTNLSAAEDQGYEFAYWVDTTSGETVTQVDSGTNISIELEAVWTPITYTITYETQGATGHGNPGTYTVDSGVSLDKPTENLPDGEKFVHWIDELGDPITTIPTGSTGDRIITAVYESNDLYVYYGNLEGGPVKAPTLFHTGDTTALAKPIEPEGCEFVCWKTLDGQTITNIDANWDANITLNAVWNYTEYSITYVLGGFGESGSNPTTYTVKTPTIIFTDPINIQAGKIFTGWSITTLFQGTTGSKTVTAAWDDITNNVTLPPIRTGYSISGETPLPVLYGQPYSFTLYLDAGYNKSIVVVKADSETLMPIGNVYTIASVTTPRTVTVTGVTLNTYTVVLPAKGPGYTVTGDSSVKHGAIYTFTVTTKAGYSADPVVMYNGSALTPQKNGKIYTYSIEGLTGDVAAGEIKVEAMPIDFFTVTFDARGGAPVPSLQIADYEDTITMPDDPMRQGFNFAGWYTDTYFQNAFNFMQWVTSDFTLYAKWTAADVGFDIEELESTIARAVKLKGTGNDGKYTAESYKELADALTNAQIEFDNPTDQTTIDAAVSALKDACQSLIMEDPTIDKGKDDVKDKISGIITDDTDNSDKTLEEVISELEKYKDKYTEKSWDEFMKALNDYLAALENSKAEDIQNAQTILYQKYESLSTEQADKNDMTLLYIGIGIGAGIILLGGIAMSMMHHPRKKETA